MLNLINNMSDRVSASSGLVTSTWSSWTKLTGRSSTSTRRIFDYFDALLLGLTATPRNEIDRNTYRIFNLEEGNPTDSYGLDQAKADGYLVGPFTINVPLNIPAAWPAVRRASDEEKESWDELDWDDDDPTPAEVTADEVNRFLFNEDTIDKMLQTVMTYGLGRGR